MLKRGCSKFKATFMIYLIVLLTVYISIVMAQEPPHDHTVTDYSELPEDIKRSFTEGFFKKYIEAYNTESKTLKFKDGRLYTGASEIIKTEGEDGALKTITLKFKETNLVEVWDGAGTPPQSKRWQFEKVREGQIILLPDGTEESISMDLDIGGKASYKGVERFSSSLTEETKEAGTSSIDIRNVEGAQEISTTGWVDILLHENVDGTRGRILNGEDSGTIISFNDNKVSEFILMGASTFRKEPKEFLPIQIAPKNSESSIAYIISGDFNPNDPKFANIAIPIKGAVYEDKANNQLRTDGEVSIRYDNNPTLNQPKLNILQITTSDSAFPQVTTNRRALNPDSIDELSAAVEATGVKTPTAEVLAETGEVNIINRGQAGGQSITKGENEVKVTSNPAKIQGSIESVKKSIEEHKTQLAEERLKLEKQKLEGQITEKETALGQKFGILQDKAKTIEVREQALNDADKLTSELESLQKQLKDLQSKGGTKEEYQGLLTKATNVHKNLIARAKAGDPKAIAIIAGIIILAIFLIYKIKKAMDEKGYKTRSPVTVRSPITKED